MEASQSKQRTRPATRASLASLGRNYRDSERQSLALRPGRDQATISETSPLARDLACKPVTLFSAIKKLTSLPSEYDFVNFNTIDGGGNVTTTVLVSPTLNFMGLDEPISIAVQLDDQTPQTVAFIPPAPPGTLPAQWGGDDGFAANSIVPVVTQWTANPGTHTLTVRHPFLFRSAKSS